VLAAVAGVAQLLMLLTVTHLLLVVVVVLVAWYHKPIQTSLPEQLAQLQLALVVLVGPSHWQLTHTRCRGLGLLVELVP
jgi:hypothetical protein